MQAQIITVQPCIAIRVKQASRRTDGNILHVALSAKLVRWCTAWSFTRVGLTLFGVALRTLLRGELADASTD